MAEHLAPLLKARRAYVVPDLKFMYVSVAKNACTSIKWLVAELAGEDSSQFKPGLGSSQTLDDGIHSRASWRRTPTVAALDPDVRKDIHPDNGWFIFGVVRDPRVRLFSAWQNKFLMHNVRYFKYADQAWYPRVPESPGQLIDDFAEFVTMLSSTPDSPLHLDTHFSSQTRLLVPDEVPYSRIYDISELAAMQSDLEAHLARLGHQRTVRLRRTNDTPLAAVGPVFAGGVRERVEGHFDRDFARFGHLWDFEKVERRAEWTKESFQSLLLVIAMADRIADLRDTASRQRRRRRRLRDRVELLEAQLRESTSHRRRVRIMLRP